MDPVENQKSRRFGTKLRVEFLVDHFLFLQLSEGSYGKVPILSVSYSFTLIFSIRIGVRSNDMAFNKVNEFSKSLKIEEPSY